MALAVGIGEYGLEVATDVGAVIVEFRQQRAVLGEAHAARDQRLIVGLVGQRMGLGIVEVLQAMFQIAQEAVGHGEFAHGGFAQDAALGQQVQHLQRRPDLQRLVAAAADQLEHLGDELDLADAARAELDVVGHVAPRHFAADLRVQLAHGVDGAVVEVLAENEGAREGGQRLATLPVQGPRLDPGVAFPLAALGDEVVLQHVEARHQRSGIAVRPQAHVHAEDLAIAGDLGQRADQLAAESGEEVEIRQALPVAVRFAVFGIDEDQVDIRGDVQFPPAQLAHADDDQLLRLALCRARCAVASDEDGGEDGGSMADRHLGQGGHGFGYLGQVRQTGQVARDDARHHPGAQAAQAGAQRRLVRRLGGEKVAHGLRSPGALQAVSQFFTDCRLAVDEAGQEAALRQNAVEQGWVVSRG